MRCDVVWSEDIPERDDSPPIIYAIDFSPDGSRLLVAIGSRVLVYDAETGDLIHSLKGHKSTVYCVSYSFDGTRFASGSADNCVIIWTDKCEGILKYSHADSIQCLSYNPNKHILASCTATDFGLWSPEHKSVHKYKVSSRVVSASWTRDGLHIALGQFNGHVSIRDKQGNEKVLIERSEPIWCLQWSPINKDGLSTLVIGCWDQTLSFWQMSGQQIGKDKVLGFDPCSVEHFNDGEFLFVTGSNREVILMTREGVMLSPVATTANWVWSCRARPKTKQFALATNGGELELHKITFNTVHGLYQDRYAYRDSMADVIIQHMISDQKVRIRTRDYVKKIAIYRDRLAIQLADRILIYEASPTDEFDMHYKLRDKIVQNLRCNLLVVTSCNVVLCQEKKLQLFAFTGAKIREWVFDAIIRYIKVVGGPAGREGLLIGLKDGHVMKIFVDNKFPISLMRHNCAIRCLDLSASRNKIAIVDENSNVVIYDLVKKQVQFEVSGANSVAWNAQCEDMFCWSGAAQLNIKTAQFPLHRQRLHGFVVGFKGSKVFCLQYTAMVTIDIFQSQSMYSYIAVNDAENAFKVACLGVTEEDWRALALHALSTLQLDIARKSFIRLRDIGYTELISQMSLSKGGEGAQRDKSFWAAHIQAYQGRFDEAAAMFCKAGHAARAMEMFLDLRDWTKAKAIMERMGHEELQAGAAGGMDMMTLLRREAGWLMDSGDAASAAEVLWAAHDYHDAIEIMGKNKWHDLLMDKIRRLSSTERAVLQQAAVVFTTNGHYQYAKETYVRLDDIQALMALCVKWQNWEMALDMVAQHPEHRNEIYLPYARWLAVNDRFEEAQEAFALAGRPDEAARMLSQLTWNSLNEKRFRDASFYYRQTAMDLCRNGSSSTASSQEAIRESLLRAQLYHAFDNVHRYCIDPFTVLTQETIFGSALFVLNMEGTRANSPIAHQHVSHYALLVTLAKLATAMEAFKLARHCYELLQKLCLPDGARESIDIGALMIRARPFSDRNDLLPVCYRCSTKNNLITVGDKCSNCSHQFVRSSCSFEVLPFVQFKLADGMSDEEAIKILESGQKVHVNGETAPAPSDSSSSANILSLDQDPDNDGQGEENDPLMEQLLNVQQRIDGKYPDLVATRAMLANSKRSDIWRTRTGKGLDWFRCVIPDQQYSQCSACTCIFMPDTYELAVLAQGACPACRAVIDPRTGLHSKATSAASGDTRAEH